MKSKSLKINAILNTIKTVLGIVFPIITFPYISRMLQVEAIGAYNFSASIVSYFSLLASLGVSTYAIREGAQYRSDSENFSRFCNQVFSINICSTALSYFLLFLTIVFVQKINQNCILILILSIQILFQTISVGWICNIFEDFLYITIRTIGIQVLSLVLIFLFVKDKEDLVIYACIVVFANSAAGIVNFIYIRNKYCCIRLTKDLELRKHLKPILVIFSTSIAATIYISSDTTMIGFMTSDAKVGLYSTAVKVYSILKNVLNAIVTVTIPRFAILFTNRENDGDSDVINGLFSKLFKSLTVLILPVMVGLYMESEEIIYYIAGEEYLGATSSLRLLSVAIIFSLFAYMYSQCVLVPARKENTVFLATSVSAAINIIFNFYAIPHYGIEGAAITTIIAELIVFMISYIASRRYVRLIAIKNDLIKTGIGCAFIVVICVLFRYLIHSSFLRLPVCVVVSGIGYFATLFFLKNTVVYEFTMNFIAKTIQNRR